MTAADPASQRPDEAPGVTPGGDAAAAEAGSAGDAVRQLLSDAQAAVASETALYRLCAQLAATAVKGLSLWGIAALLCAFVALLSLAVGAVILLAQWLGPWPAIAIVPGVLLGVTLLCVLRARAHVRRLKQAITAVLP